MIRILFILFLPCFAFAQQKGPMPYEVTKAKLANDSVHIYSLSNNWLFHYGDDAAMAQPGYNDSGWTVVNTEMQYARSGIKATDTFSSIGWFRLHFITDSGVINMPIALQVSHYGASEFFLDGKRIAVYGKISGKDSCDYYNPRGVPLVFTVQSAGEHLLAVRYANYRAKRNSIVNHRDFAGFSVYITEATRAIISGETNASVNAFINALLLGIFIALCMAHLFLFCFYRAEVSNLFFSIFCFCLGGFFLINFLNMFSHDPIAEMRNSFVSLLLLSLGTLSFSGFTNTLFSARKTRFRIIAVCCVLAPATLLVSNGISFLFTTGLLILVFLEATVITIAAIFKRAQGSRIIGAGILLFTLFFLSNFVFYYVNGNDSVNEDTLWGKVYLVLSACAVLGLPVFMSLYLAWKFAFINRSLKNKVQEVELLSAQTIAQEQEKKKILESQNETLEREVAIRTAEVVSQKEEIERQHNELKAEKKKTDDLLLNILPAEVAEELKEKGFSKARLFEQVTVLFTDFVDFTHAGERLSPEELVSELHTCFKAFDEIISNYGIEKIKTIGDAYLAVCGLPEASADHAVKMVLAAKDILHFMEVRRKEHGDKTFEIRVGIHSGSVVAGIVGVKKFAYDIWGDTVNTAARLEQHSAPGKINISQTTYDLVKDRFTCTHRGKIPAKNKGELNMYFIEETDGR